MTKYEKVVEVGRDEKYAVLSRDEKFVQVGHDEKCVVFCRDENNPHTLVP
jgi:hypothetical protein